MSCRRSVLHEADRVRTWPLAHLVKSAIVADREAMVGKKVLVLESDADVAEQLFDGFTRLGCSVRVAQTGETGTEMANRDTPDLVVLSAELPDADGFALCQVLKQQQRLTRVPFVVIADEATDEMFARHREMQGHAEAYLHKPFGFPELVVLAEELVPSLCEVPDVPVDVMQDEADDDCPTQVGPMPPELQATIRAAGTMARDTIRPPMRSEAPRPSSPSIAGLVTSPAPPPVAANVGAERKKSGKRPSVPPARAGSARKTRAKESDKEVSSAQAGADDAEQLRVLVESLRADKAMAAKRADDFKARIAKNEAQIEKLEGQLTALRQSTATLQSAHAQALKAESAEGDRKAALVRGEADNRIEKIEQAHRQQVAKLEEAARARIAEAQARHQAELDSEKAVRGELERKLAEEHRRGLASASERHAEQLRTLELAVEQAKVAAQQAEQSHASGLDHVEEAHRAATASLLQSHRVELDKAAEQLENERAVFEQKLAAAHADGTSRWDELEARMAAMVTAHRGELDAMAARHAAATDALGEAHREQLSLARRQVEEERETHQTALQREQERHEQQLRRLEQGNALTLQEAARGPSETLARNAALQEQVGELLQQIAKLEDRLRAADIARQQAVANEQTVEREAAAQREAHHREAMDRLEEAHRVQLAAVETRHAGDLQRVEQEHAELMARFEQAHREATGLVMQAHRAELDRAADDVQRTKQHLEHAIASTGEDARKRGGDFATQLASAQAEHRRAIDELSKQHTVELLAARQAQADAMARAKEEFDASVASIRADAERERGRHREALERLEREHGRALQEAAAQPSGALSRNLELEREATSLQRRIAELEGQLQEASLIAVRAEADLLAAHSHAQLARDEEHRKAMDELREEHRTALVAWESDAAEKIAKLEAAHRQAIDAAEQQHRTGVRAVSAAAQEKATEVQTAHAAQLAKLEQEHRAQLADEQSRMSARLAAVEATHLQRLEALREEHARELAQASSVPVTTSEPVAEQTGAEREQHEALVQRMLDAHQAELAVQKQLRTEELRQAEDAHQQELQKVSDTYQESLRALESRLTGDLQRISDEHRGALTASETRHQLELDALEHKRAVEAASARALIDAEVARVLADRAVESEAAHQDTLAGVEARHAANVAALRQSHEAAIEALQSAHEADMRSRERELASVREASVREVEQRLVERENAMQRDHQVVFERRVREYVASLQELQDGLGRSLVQQERSFREAIDAERRVFDDKAAQLEARLGKEAADREASWAAERSALQRELTWLSEQSRRLESSLREVSGLADSRAALVSELQAAYNQVQSELGKARGSMVAALAQMAEAAVVKPAEAREKAVAEGVRSDVADAT